MQNGERGTCRVEQQDETIMVTAFKAMKLTSGLQLI